MRHLVAFAYLIGVLVLVFNASHMPHGYERLETMACAIILAVWSADASIRAFVKDLIDKIDSSNVK